MITTTTSIVAFKGLREIAKSPVPIPVSVRVLLYAAAVAGTAVAVKKNHEKKETISR